MGSEWRGGLVEGWEEKRSEDAYMLGSESRFAYRRWSRGQKGLKRCCGGMGG